MELPRRQFLKATLGSGLCASAIFSSFGKGETRPWKMKLSTSTVQYRGETLQEAVRRIGRLGFEAIDIWSHFNWGGSLCEHLEKGLKMGPETFLALLSEHGLKLNAATCYRVPADKFAVQLGKMGGCVVVRGSTNEFGKGADLAYDDLKNAMKKFTASIRPEAEALAENQCVLAIENHGGKALLNTSDSFKLFLELNKSPNAGIALAPYHIQRVPESVAEIIRLCGERLKFFYAWQFAGGKQQLPGIGPVDFGPWLESLAEVNYQGYVNPFMHGEPAPDEMDGLLKESRSYLVSKYEATVTG